MASYQSYETSDHAYHNHAQPPTYHTNTDMYYDKNRCATDIYHDKNQYTNPMMGHSGQNMFNRNENRAAPNPTFHKKTDVYHDKYQYRNEQSMMGHSGMMNQRGQHAPPNYAHKPTTNFSTGTAYYEKQCMPNMHNQMKLKKKKSRGGKHYGSGSDSGSCSDSD